MKTRPALSSGQKRVALAAVTVITVAAASYAISRYRTPRPDTVVVPSNVKGDSIKVSTDESQPPDFVSRLSGDQLEFIKQSAKETIPLRSAALCMANVSPLDDRAVQAVIDGLQQRDRMAKEPDSKIPPSDGEAMICLGALAAGNARFGKPVADINALAALAISYMNHKDMTERILGTELAWTLLAQEKSPSPALKSAYDLAISNEYIKVEFPIHVGSLRKYREAGRLSPLEYDGYSTAQEAK